MENLNDLVSRIVVLETEVRLVKEQLAKAQNAIICLATALSNRRSEDHGAEVDPNTAHLQHVQAEMCRLSDLFNFAQPFNPTGAKPNPETPTRAGHLGITHFSKPGQPSGSYMSTSGVDPFNENLLSFDDLNDPPSTKLSTHSSSTGPSGANSILDEEIAHSLPLTTPSEGGQGSFASAPPAQPIRADDSNAHATQDDLVDASDHVCTPALCKDAPCTPERATDPETKPNPKPEYGVVTVWRPMRDPAPPEREVIFSCRFTDHEHNHLANTATFVEDMTEEELDAHWKSIAAQSRNQRHSAAEWRRYYEEVVRPAYLENNRLKKTVVEVERARNGEFEQQSEPIEEPFIEHLKNGIRSRRFVMTNVPFTTTLEEIKASASDVHITSAAIFKTTEMKTSPPMETDVAVIIFRGVRDADEYYEMYVQGHITF